MKLTTRTRLTLALLLLVAAFPLLYLGVTTPVSELLPLAGLALLGAAAVLAMWR